MDNVTQAAIVYLKRQARIIHPDGKLDKQGRWFPSEEEHQPYCCNPIRPPTKSYPWSYMVHCRTLKHVCNLYKVEEKDVRYILSKKGLPLLIGSGDPWVDTYLEKKLKTKGVAHGYTIPPRV